MSLSPLSNSLLANPFDPFNQESFNPISPFTLENPLASEVQSDHAEIGLHISDRHVLNSWNISNPAYHCYFKFGDKPPFHQSHLFVNKPYNEGVMDPVLAKKTEDQIATIAERFTKGQVHIQIIVEGFESFYEKLAAKIKEAAHPQFALVSLLNQKPDNWENHKNVTGILINTSRFSVLNSGVISKKYEEAEDAGKKNDFCLPFAHLRDTEREDALIVAGVHVSGCKTQHPKSGLETLAKTMKELDEANTFEPADVIAAGDFNTPPRFAKESMLGLLDSRGILLNPEYPTHVNPRSEAANYDQIAILKGRECVKYEMAPLSELSPATQQFVASVEKSRKLFALLKS